MEKWKVEKGRKAAPREAMLYVFGVLGVAIVIYSGLLTLFGERAVPSAFAQQDQYLSRRIDQIEQRFYSIESRINRLEQDSRTIAPVTPQIMNNNDTEIQFLRSQVSALRLRLGEVECGLLRVDERTLPAAAKLGPKKSGASESDKCRLNPRAPIELSARP